MIVMKSIGTAVSISVGSREREVRRRGGPHAISVSSVPFSKH